MKKKGFTLVELLAVIAILAILVIISIPNVMSMFNQAKQSSFENGVKQHIKALNTRFFTTGILVYSNVVEGAEKLDMDGEEFDYYIELDTRGNIKTLNITNGEYKIEASGTTSNPVKLEQIGDTIKSEAGQSGELFVMDSSGDITGESSVNNSQVVDQINMRVQISDFYSPNKVIMSYDSTKQTPEQFYASTLGKTGDMDVNYYKLSNNMAGNNSQYYIDASINGNIFKGYLEKNIIRLHGHDFDSYGYYSDEFESHIPFLINTDVFNYDGGYFQVNFTKGLWFYDLVGAFISSAEYITIKESTFSGTEKTIDGINCVKVSNYTMTKDGLIGKTGTMVGTGVDGELNRTLRITEDVMREYGSYLIVDETFVIIPNDGIYVKKDFLMELIDVNVKVQ